MGCWSSLWSPPTFPGGGRVIFSRLQNASHPRKRVGALQVAARCKRMVLPRSCRGKGTVEGRDTPDKSFLSWQILGGKEKGAECSWLTGKKHCSRKSRLHPPHESRRFTNGGRSILKWSEVLFWKDTLRHQERLDEFEPPCRPAQRKHNVSEDTG